MSHPEGEGPSNPKASKEHADRFLKDPRHHAEKGTEKDLRTVDHDLADPQHQKKERDG